jgi:hypothetical protein
VWICIIWTLLNIRLLKPGAVDERLALGAGTARYDWELDALSPFALIKLKKCYEESWSLGKYNME